MDNFDLVAEVQSVVNEIKFAVKEVSINNKDLTYFTVATLENNIYCVRLTTTGFLVEKQVLAKGSEVNLEGKCFESIYAFLDTASPGYRESFVSSLSGKLKGLEQK